MKTTLSNIPVFARDIRSISIYRSASSEAGDFSCLLMRRVLATSHQDMPLLEKNSQLHAKYGVKVEELILMTTYIRAAAGSKGNSWPDQGGIAKVIPYYLHVSHTSTWWTLSQVGS